MKTHGKGGSLKPYIRAVFPASVLLSEDVVLIREDLLQLICSGNPFHFICIEKTCFMSVQLETKITTSYM